MADGQTYDCVETATSGQVFQPGLSSEQLDALEAAVLAALAPTAADVLLHIGCGNGQLTRRLANHCRIVVAVDASASLIESAKSHCAAPHIRYRQLPGLALPDDLPPPGRRFDRVCLSDALHYFAPNDLAALLTRLKALCVPGFSVFYSQDRCSSTADAKARPNWTRPALAALAQDQGFDCRLLDQVAGRDTAHDRFDALLTAKASTP